MGKQRVCTVCQKQLSQEDTVAWADSGLPLRHLACGQHLETAKWRLRAERDNMGPMGFSRLDELEVENEKLRERNRRLADAMTSMASLVDELTEKLKSKGH